MMIYMTLIYISWSSDFVINLQFMSVSQQLWVLQWWFLVHILQLGMTSWMHLSIYDLDLHFGPVTLLSFHLCQFLNNCRYYNDKLIIFCTYIFTSWYDLLNALIYIWPWPMFHSPLTFLKMCSFCQFSTTVNTWYISTSWNPLIHIWPWPIFHSPVIVFNFPFRSLFQQL